MIRKSSETISKKIEEYFFSNPTALVRFRELERILKLPLPSIIRHCKKLKEKNILTTKKIGNVTFYTANKNNEEYILKKRLYNFRILYESKLIDFLKKEFNNPTIILFGSYFRGEDDENSDIDIFIETPIHKNLNLKKFEKKLKRKIQLFQHKNIDEIKNIHLKNNIINGLVLNGFLEVFK